MNMKRIHILLIGAVAFIGLSCTKEGPVTDIVPENGGENPEQVATACRDIKVFYASFASEGAETKVYLDENSKIHWNAGDRISIFNRNTANGQYAFAGSDGDRSGSFTFINNGVSGSNLSRVYAVYPYKSSTSITTAGVINFDLPATQTYLPNSFGLGANTMVAVSDGQALYFKNACGYLVLNMYGVGQVASISLKTKGGVKIAGDATITLNGDTPVVTTGANAVDEVLLDCSSNPVQIGFNASEATEFWFVLPPVALSGGLTLTITGASGGTYVKSTSNTFIIGRNSIFRINPFEINVSSGSQIEEGEELDGGSY